MAKAVSVPPVKIEVQPERTHFHFMLAKNPNYFGNIPGSQLEPNFKLITDTSYEQLTCVGYNPDTQLMEATFAIKRSVGYSGKLCSTGSFEHVRFYLDFHDGAGFIDQGSVAINVHDIPAGNDCTGQSQFPIIYSASLAKKTRKFSSCSKPSLPTLRAILSWNNDPPANSPNWKPVWGNVMECEVQLKPQRIFNPGDFSIDFSSFLDLAVSSPSLNLKQAAAISGLDLAALNPQPLPPKFNDVVKQAAELKVPASRFAYKTVYNMIKYPVSDITMSDKLQFTEAKIDFTKIIDELAIPLPVDKTKANVDYEELECVGLDYNTETLVATLRIKKKSGFSTNLCGIGSREYIAFWVNWNTPCGWEYINTVQLNVHDIEMTTDHLCYSVTLPLDATFHRQLCSTPNLVQVRGVLSWNVPPSTTDPDKLEFYGNRVDAHVQIKPGRVLDPNNPKALYTIIGGVDVDHVNDVTGLTKPGSIFAYNALPVPTGAPFDGKIVINGPSFVGHKYRFKVTNLTTLASYYLSNALETEGWSNTPPNSPLFTQTPDASNYYDFLPPNKNVLNVLARFTPGTNDRLLVEMDVLGIPGVFAKVIQMDNVEPVIKVSVDDGGDCTKYKKGDTITGHFYVNDLYISQWSFSSNWGGSQSGNANTAALPGTPFSIATTAAGSPCGAVYLSAHDKTIINSQSVGHHVSAHYNICLKP
ncbi:MAG: hypothetical protein NTW29_05665 [Bacteroidetes bacterium]|nr:hypothetical protein [Bacteroidota bacterium]